MCEEIKNITDEILSRLNKEFDPLNVYLFGSYAWGIPNQDSDLDLLVVIEQTKDSKILRERKAYKSLRDMKLILPIDILVRTKDEIFQYLEDKNSIYNKIYNSGKLLYEKY